MADNSGTDGRETISADCLIIGGGPAGLTAAIYLARFRRKVIVVDCRESRARYIKTSFNYPGFVNGIQGDELLENLRIQAREFGAQLIEDRITSLQKTDDGFMGESEKHRFLAQKTLLATGVVDEKPGLSHISEFIYQGAVRFCPVCDGFEAMDKRIGVMGPVDHIVGKSLFLRCYTSKLFLLPTDHLNFAPEQIENLRQSEISLPKCIVTDIRVSDGRTDKVTAVFSDDSLIELDVLYPAMGAKPRSDLAIQLGAAHNDQNCLLSNTHQESSVPGLYVAGDLTTDLSQISVAIGQAAIAATDMHNRLPRNPR